MNKQVVFDKISSKEQYLEFLGDTQGNEFDFQEMALNEAYENEDMLFTFENGMQIPNCKSKVTGELTMKNIKKESGNIIMFLCCFSRLTKKYLNFTLSDQDRKNLTTEYDAD